MTENSTKMKSSHAKVLAEVRERHPELPSRLIRHARTEFYYWFGMNSLRNGRIREGAALLTYIVCTDPFFVARTSFRQALGRALRRLARRLGFTESFLGRHFLELPTR